MNGYRILMILAIGIFWSCQNETTPEVTFDTNLLTGKWEVTEAMRRGEPTGTLAGAFMEFKSDGKMVSNILGTNEEANYTVKKGVIAQKGGRQDIDWTIDTLDANSMTLSMSFNETPFKISLKRILE